MMLEARLMLPAEALATEPLHVVCDDCYDELIRWARVYAPELLRQPPG